MKVLMINSVCGVGSTGRICTDIATELKSGCNDCLICYGRGTAQGFENTYKICYDFSLYMHVLKTRMTDKHGLGSSQPTKKLINKIQEFDPDVIHLHNLHGYYLNYKLLFEFLAEYNRPVIWTLHDCWAFTGHCSHFDFIGCNKWQTECFDCPLKREYPTSLFRSAAKQNYALKKNLFTRLKDMTIVTPSKWLGELVSKSFFAKYPVKVINNGVDLTKFKPTPSNIRDSLGISKKFVILAVANIWSERKGINDIIKIADTLSENETLVMVGKLQSVMKHDKIVHIEQTRNIDELVKLYTAADVFINTTYEDVFGMVNIEAAACGTPVVTYSTGGTPETVDAQCGCIVNKGDYIGLLDAAREYGRNKSKLSELCQMHADRFGLEIFTENYFDLYQDIQKFGN